MWVWQSPKAKEWGLELRGPIVVYRTQRGKGVMDRIGSHRKFCRILATFSNFVAIILMAVMILIMAVAIKGIPLRIKGGTGTALFTGFSLNYTEFLIFGVLALIVAMIIHEFAHGIQSRANDVRVEASGLMYAVVPLGAFVEMNEEDSNNATLKEKMSIYSAGISINFIVAAISFVLLAMLMLAPLSNTDGVNDDSVGLYSVSDGSPAYLAGLSPGSVIISIDGEEVYIESGITNQIFQNGNVLGGKKYTVEYLTPEGSVTESIWLGVYVESVVKENPAELYGLPKNSLLIEIDGVSITGPDSFSDFLASTSPNQEVEVRYVDVASESEGTVDIKLGSNGDIGFMGVRTSYSGMILTTPGFILGKASNPIYGETAAYGMLHSALQYPFLSMEGFSPVPDVFHWWFDAPGGNVFWMFGAMIYWMFWVNLLLGITNALPLIPFDGGYLFRGWVTQLLEKMRYKTEEIREKVAKNISSAVSGFMAFLLILIVFAVVF
jgi:membrane-associated protease RseP (regulator of RpoE activity)